MRKIEFRGKSVATGTWRYGMLDVEPGGYYEIFSRSKNGFSKGVVDPETVGQFTGVTDTNNEPIYEGDIVERYGDRGTIIFQDGCFSVDWEDSTNTLFWYASDNRSMALEIIGNIHDNKNRLKWKQN